GDDKIGNECTKKGDKKGMNTTQMRVQAPRLGCLGECEHLCLIPLNNVWARGCKLRWWLSEIPGLPFAGIIAHCRPIMETNALFVLFVLSGTVQSFFPILKKLLAEKLCAYYNREENLIKSKIFDVEVGMIKLVMSARKRVTKKGMNTTQMRVQAPRLGCLGECEHLCLIPLNNVVWKNNIDDAAIY
ncbi:9569_t:CDS:2, partial [Cetraspora pellucida]